ncbi:SDR family oxidoreductase [Aequorivita sp. CIP111184]|uniref:SDR family oxidoreductase n=1 Tax=Aequorivita sp. CIP111184 TaxID=2211356 RepID=UPI000DBBF365|nr:SDR family oxidoreductase [Aequorivita sp. CIP111184]SRX54849.1 putative oxidoreductase [Aequorivita sp. CIP111184]
MNLKNKVAVITGASGGIGGAIAEKLSEKGCKLALAGRDMEALKKLKERLVGESITVEIDVADSQSVNKGFETINNHFEEVDILVNSAGVMPLSYLKNRHLKEWLQTIEVNVKGSLRMIDGVLPYMKKQNGGHIVNIASVDGKELYKGGAVYGASKAAIIALSRAMRMELSPEFGIKVTSIEPGTVATDLRDDITDKELLNDKDYSKNEPKLKSEDIARAVVYALSEPDGVNINELLIKPTGKS